MDASDMSSHRSSPLAHHLPARRAVAGFTLVEVLAALAIVSLGMLGVIQAISQTANNGVYLRDRTVAHWIAMNRVTEVRLEPRAPTIGNKSDDIEMAGRKWRWSMEVTQTAVESIRRIDVNVALAETKDQPLAFVSGFYGTAVDQPGSAAMLWPGGTPVDGGGGGGGTDDPNKQKPDPNNPQTDPGNTPQEPQPDPGTTDPGGSSPPRTDPQPGDPGEAQ